MEHHRGHGAGRCQGTYATALATHYATDLHVKSGCGSKRFSMDRPYH